MVARTLIIAEAGVNHNGDMNLAKRLIDSAAISGADLVKFQTFNAHRLVTRTASKANYQDRNTHGHSTQYSMLKQLELSLNDHAELQSHCMLRKIGFLSTAFDIESVKLLLQLGQTRLKIPSGEITNLPYLRYIGCQDKEVILSTGMAELGEIEAAIAVLEMAGTPRSKITILHCTTEYPTPMVEVNLRAMQAIRASFGVSVGYSDHSQGIEVAIAAVALGATVIEKHLTLGRHLPGPDHQASIEPDEFAAMVRAIRNIEVALGDGIKRVTPSEARNRSVARKSLVALRPIIQGEIFTDENVTVKRPGTGISPMRWDDIIGRESTRDYKIDDLIQF